MNAQINPGFLNQFLDLFVFSSGDINNALHMHAKDVFFYVLNTSCICLRSRVTKKLN